MSDPDKIGARGAAEAAGGASLPAGPAALLDLIFERLPAGVVYLDSNLRIVHMNPAGARAVGASAEAAGRTFDEAASAARPALAPAFATVLETGQPLTFWGYPLRPPPRDAAGDASTPPETTYWDYTLWPLDLPAGGVLLFAVEVTDRVRAERGMQDAVAAARQSAGKLETLIEQMADGVVVADRDGRVLTANSAAVEMLGDSAAVLAADFAAAGGQPAPRRADDEHPLAPEELPWRRAAATGETSRDAEMMVERGGAEAYLSVNASPLRDADGQVTGAVAVLRDTTETRRLIGELREANRRLEEFNRLKAEFVANMSHELRTPLTAIIGFAQLMQMNVGGAPPLERQHAQAVERILRNGRHLLSLIDDVLDLSKIEVGRISIHPDYVDLVETVQSAFHELQSLANQKGLDYRLVVRDEFPVAYADPVRVRQVVINLLSNAIKFTVRGRVEAEMSRAGEDSWQFVVRDTGVGIRQEAVGLIFERFRQVDGSTTRQVGGVGLGLTIVEQIVRLLGGEIDVSSVYGEGSTFSVRLPLNTFRAAPAERADEDEPRARDARERAAHPAPADETQSEAEGGGAGPLVLVIEDDPDAASLLSETLEGAGYRVRVAESGEAGLAIAREAAPSVITLDIMMPKMDGWSVLQSLRADERTSRIPVVICSIVDNRPLGYRLGASDYLVKPVSPERLVRSLRGVGATPDGGDGGYVLVVDDEQGFRALLLAALKDAGFAARAAASGETALGVIRREPPSAILSDLIMPNGMSGFELVARLRADERTAAIPVILVTAKDVTEEDLRLVSGQIADVIRKGDLLLPDLATRLREALEEIGVHPADG
jgi:PAS domain S-box-containing protein